MQPISTSLRQSEEGWFTRRELQEYLGVGKNAVPGIADRFKLTCIDGSYDEREVWRRLLGLEPVGDPGVHLLRMGLRDIHWVAGLLGKATSTVRNEISSGTFPYGHGVQLGTRTEGQEPRLRRWCAPVLDAELRGVPLASIREASSVAWKSDDFGLPPLGDDLGEFAAAVIPAVPPKVGPAVTESRTFRASVNPRDSVTASR